MHPYAHYLQPELARILGNYRTAHLYTQERMAENLRISPRNYSNLELGKSGLSGPTLLFFFLTMTDAEQLATLQQLRFVINQIDG